MNTIRCPGCGKFKGAESELIAHFDECEGEISCDSCGYPTKSLAHFSTEWRKEKDRPGWFCRVCLETRIDTIYRFRAQYSHEIAVLARIIGYTANMILDEVRQGNTADLKAQI